MFAPPLAVVWADLAAVGLAGALAGLAVAVPLGPIGVLLVERSVTHGRAAGLVGATAIATVDLGYATLAVTTTSAVHRVAGASQGPALVVAAVALAGLGLHALVRSRSVTVAEVGAVATPQPRGRTFLLFLGLTAVNPATLLTFAAVAVTLGERVAGAAHRAVFVVAVAGVSLAWQAGLASLGGIAGACTGPTFRAWTQRIGGVVLLGFAAALALRGL